MTTIPIEKTNALKAFREADEKGRALLTNLFGKEVLSDNVMDRIKTMDDVYAELGEEEFDKDGLTDDEIAYKEAKLIARALNEGWFPDMTDGTTKYYPWMKYTPGVGWSYYDYEFSISDSSVGSRLLLKSSTLAKYAATQFPNVYNNLFS
ncbi:MAG TPA: hypothetical protein DIW47_11040 [Bacteroidetes bacterium]|nr:hypothetical protein [Bacteroidota bacterium]